MTQKEALDILKTGRNVFLTGAAGSGKTFVLREYIKYLNSLNASIGITASTGIAATHMGGTTIHSWSGIGIRDSLNKSELSEIADKSHIKNKVKNASVLIIDEVSMLHHFRLDLVNLVLKEIKNSTEPFGGLQVVFCGDFFQLPPIRKSYEKEVLFAYHSEAWKNLNLKICYLEEQHRQNDLEYLKVLNAVRDAKVSNDIIEILNTRFDKKSDFEPTKLYSHNRDVNSENDQELDKISGKIFEYDMMERGRKNLVEALKKSCLAPEVLRLKVGAKVMFIKNNFEAGFVNGTMGVVIECGFEAIRVKTLSERTIEVERESWQIEEDGKLKAEISQYPLRLAWAITVHKSQGMSLDEAEVNLADSFEKGMGYVALSRVRSLAGLYLKGINDMALQVNEEVLEFDKTFRKHSKTNSFHITTMGEKKINEMHADFANKIKGEQKKKKEPKISTVEETKNMLDEGMNIKEIAEKRALKQGTILDHIEQIKKEDPKYNIYNLQGSITKNKFKQIYNAFQKIGLNEEGKRPLSPVKALLPTSFSFDDLRLVRLFL